VNCKLDLLLATVWAEGGSVTPGVIAEYGKTCTLEGLLPIPSSINAEAAMGTKRLTLSDSLGATASEAGTEGLIDVKSAMTSYIQLLSVRG